MLDAIALTSNRGIRLSCVLLPQSISLYRISLQRNDQRAVNNADLHLRQGADNESQPMSSQGAINAEKEQPMSTKCAARTRSQTRGPRLIRRRLLEEFFFA